MNNHVSGIFLISILWLLLIVIAGYYLPRILAKVFLLFALIAHSYGASTWISPNYGIMYSFLFILINSIFYLKVEDFSKELPAVRPTRG